MSRPFIASAWISASPSRPALSWAVNAPTNRLGRGDLAGNYGGVGANASVGVGGGGNFLVGGPANSYALQPISVQGQTGLNVAAGIADLELTAGRRSSAAAIAPAIAITAAIAERYCSRERKRPAKAGLFCCWRTALCA